MHKIIGAAVSLLFVCQAIAITPAFCEDAPAKPAAASSKGGGMGKFLLNFPVTATSFAVGAVFGTPIAMVRKARVETVNATKDLIGESKNPILVTLFGTGFGLPAGALSGALQGVVLGPYHSAKNSVDEPFSKDVFSLGEMKE